MARLGSLQRHGNGAACLHALRMQAFLEHLLDNNVDGMTQELERQQRIKGHDAFLRLINGEDDGGALERVHPVKF